MTASIASYARYVNKLREALPPGVHATPSKYEAKGEYEAPEHQQVLFGEVYARYLCRLDPCPTRSSGP